MGGIGDLDKVEERITQSPHLVKDRGKLLASVKDNIVNRKIVKHFFLYCL